VLPWSEYSQFAISLFAILSPFSALPIFLVLTDRLSQAERAHVATVATTTVAIVLTATAIAGQTILAVLDTSLGAFQVGGGIVLMMLAFSMLRAETSSVQHRPEEAVPSTHAASIGVIPLGLPLLAGPGSISSVIIEMNRSAEFIHAVLVIGCILVICAANWLVLRLSEPISKRLGQTGLNITTRLFGLILMGTAVQFIATGLRTLFPALG
jgi:multiple antibiotic resistance protein